MPGSNNCCQAPIIIARYQVRCPELSYRLAPIEEYRGRENASAVLRLTDVRIEVMKSFYCLQNRY